MKSVINFLRSINYNKGMSRTIFTAFMVNRSSVPLSILSTIQLIFQFAPSFWIQCLLNRNLEGHSFQGCPTRHQGHLALKKTLKFETILVHQGQVYRKPWPWGPNSSALASAQKTNNVFYWNHFVVCTYSHSLYWPNVHM